jgi:hypothetical protein
MLPSTSVSACSRSMRMRTGSSVRKATLNRSAVASPVETSARPLPSAPTTPAATATGNGDVIGAGPSMLLASRISIAFVKASALVTTWNDDGGGATSSPRCRGTPSRPRPRW